MPSNQSALGDENDVDVVSSMLNGSPFKLRPDEEKETVLKNGRPLPKLNIIKRDGSQRYNKLFCWPCVLMRPESSSWCSTGNDDMKRFTSLATKHAICKSHMKAISEYDETLAKFGLPAEFADELTTKCKEEETISDESDPEDLFNVYFKRKIKKFDSTTTQTDSNFPEVSEKKDESEPVKKITFKTWKEMTRDNFPLSSSKYLEDQKLYKWKRKIAKQELRNARLTGEKLKYEIEVLKAKSEYYKSMREISLKEDSEHTGIQAL